MTRKGRNIYIFIKTVIETDLFGFGHVGYLAVSENQQNEIIVSIRMIESESRHVFDDWCEIGRAVKLNQRKTPSVSLNDTLRQNEELKS